MTLDLPAFSLRHRFSDWPNADVPQVAVGVYAVWEADALVYCGMSGREFETAVAASRVRYGLVTRLGSHCAPQIFHSALGLAVTPGSQPSAVAA